MHTTYERVANRKPRYRQNGIVTLMAMMAPQKVLVLSCLLSFELFRHFIYFFAYKNKSVKLKIKRKLYRPLCIQTSMLHTVPFFIVHREKFRPERGNKTESNTKLFLQTKTRRENHKIRFIFFTRTYIYTHDTHRNMLSSKCFYSK